MSPLPQQYTYSNTVQVAYPIFSFRNERYINSGESRAANSMRYQGSSSARPMPVSGRLFIATKVGAGAADWANTGGMTAGDITTGGGTTGGTITGGTTTGGTTGGGATGGGTTAGAAQVGLLTGLVSKVTAPVRANTLPLTEAPVFTVTDAKAKIVPAKLESVPSVADEPICQKILQACAPLTKRTRLADAVVKAEPT